MNLTKNFSLDEFLVSETAYRRGIDNSPSTEHLKNLGRLARVLEDVRARLGKPILISSGYRSPELNAAIGGSGTSAHMQGLAADFICPGFGSPFQVSQAIAGMDIRFDQLIHEFGRWVHFGLKPEDEVPRRHLLTAVRRDGCTVYEAGISTV